MSEHSAIEWCDATWNPTTGCTKVSPGCANCYIETTTPFRVQHRTFERGHIPLKLHHGRLEQPLRWTKPKRIFVNSLSDLFHADVPDAFIDQVFAVMALCPQHTFQILTKRADRMRQYVTGLSERLGELWDLTNQPTWITLPAGRSFPRYPENWPLPNVWLGVSVENQRFADERIPLLLQTPTAVRFISAEPLLGPLSLGRYGWLSGCDACCNGDRCEGPPECIRFNRRSCPICKGTSNGINLDWVIIGGESGPARQFNIEWAREIIAQCRPVGVPVFVKQLGSRPFEQYAVNGGTYTNPMLGADRLRARKGGDPAEWPEDLRVREFPELAVRA